MNRLITLFTTKNPDDAARELRGLEPPPTISILRKTWKRFASLNVKTEIRNVLYAYCKERGYDPLGPFPGRQDRPLAGEDRIYNVQWDKRYNRPFLRIPLDPLGSPPLVKARFAKDGMCIEIHTYAEG